MASAISQLDDTVRGSMLLSIVSFGYTEVYLANQMAGPCDFAYTGLDFVAQSCINHGINEGWLGIREKLGKSWVI